HVGIASVFTELAPPDRRRDYNSGPCLVAHTRSQHERSPVVEHAHFVARRDLARKSVAWMDVEPRRFLTLEKHWKIGVRRIERIARRRRQHGQGKSTGKLRIAGD